MTKRGISLRTMALVAALAVCVAATSACGSSSNPNSPSNPNAPVVASIGAALVVGGSVQTITVTGQRFTSGLTILLDNPNGVWTTYSGDAITVKSATEFTAKVMLDRAGVWDITVNNPDGTKSNELQFTVAAAAQ